MSNQPPAGDVDSKNVTQQGTETETPPTAEKPASEGAKMSIETPATSKTEVTITPLVDDGCPKPPCPVAPKWWQTYLLGLYLSLVFILLSYLLLKLWIRRDNGDELWLFWGFFRRQIQDEVRVLAIVMIAGALGSFFHAAKSFTAFVGSQRVYVSWFWWYLLRPFSGMALAAIFYFVLRGGMLTGQVSSDQISVYGVASLAGLAGLFSDQAALKLNEVFCNLFKTDDPRSDKLTDTETEAANKRKPVISSISPQEVKRGTDANVTITGTSFVKESNVTLAGKPVEKTFTNPTTLVANLKAKDIPDAGSFDLIVANPAPAGSSKPITLKVIS